MKRWVSKLLPAGMNAMDGKALSDGKVPGEEVVEGLLVLSLLLVVGLGGDVPDGFGGCCCPCWTGSGDRCGGLSLIHI